MLYLQRVTGVNASKDTKKDADSQSKHERKTIKTSKGTWTKSKNGEQRTTGNSQQIDPHEII